MREVIRESIRLACPNSKPCCNSSAMTAAPSRLIFPTPCECTEPGWCARHKCHKDRAQFEYCRRLIAWFEMWERGEVPISAGQPALVARDPCRHFGPEVRRQDCPTCLGHVQLKIFACRIHQECALSVNAVAVRGCATCADYQPLTEGKA